MVPNCPLQKCIEGLQAEMSWIFWCFFMCWKVLSFCPWPNIVMKITALFFSWSWFANWCIQEAVFLWWCYWYFGHCTCNLLVFCVLLVHMYLRLVRASTKFLVKRVSKSKITTNSCCFKPLSVILSDRKQKIHVSFVIFLGWLFYPHQLVCHYPLGVSYYAAHPSECNNRIWAYNELCQFRSNIPWP